jgi:flagellar biosynthesis protein FlhF
MRLKRIEAPTVAQALQRLRQELGEQAVILHTRTLGAGARTRVEVLGAVDAPPGLADPAAAALAATAAAEIPPAAAGDGRRDEIAQRLARFRAAVPGVPLTSAGSPAGAGGPLPGVGGQAAGVACLPPCWEPAPGRARRIAFVGPTGAGKTTTLAKAAARAHLDHGCRVGLVTMDTYRIGAVPQLASYAEILGVPLAVAHSPEDLGRAAGEADADLVFVDTIGRSPLGPGVDGLRPYLEAAGADDVVLVLPVALRVADALRAAAAFARLAPNRLCMTKLDETDYHEPIAIVSQVTGLPLTWLGTGQSVPDDLEDATPERVAALVAAGRAA